MAVPKRVDGNGALSGKTSETELGSSHADEGDGSEES